MYGPDITFAGIPRTDLTALGGAAPGSHDVVVLGAPFDGGTVAGLDIVEVATPYDHAEVTAYLANRVVLEALSGITWRRRRLAGENPRRPEYPLLEGR